MKKVVTAIVTLGIIGIGAFIFKDNVLITPIDTHGIVHPSEDVMNQFGQLKVNGFTWISEDVHWLNNSVIEFNGKRATEESIYYNFDINSLEIQEVDVEKHLDNELILYEDSDKILYTDRVLDGLLMKVGEVVTELVSKQVFSTSNDFLLSENSNKIGFLNENRKHYIAYDTKSGKSSVMAYQKGSFESLKSSDVIRFSNDGGFISFEDKSEFFVETKFSIVGADSGRYYGKNIKGMNPTFSTDSKMLAFVYTGEMTQDSIGAKIGLFILKHKKIIYLDTLMVNEILFPELAWSQDANTIYAITKTSDEHTSINEFNIKDGSRKGTVLPVAVDVARVREINIINNQGYIVVNNGDLISVDLDSGRYNLYEGLKQLPNGRYLKKTNANEVIMYTDNELYLLSQEGHRVLSKYEGQVRGLYLTDDNTKVALLIDNEDKIHLQVSTLKDGL